MLYFGKDLVRAFFKAFQFIESRRNLEICFDLLPTIPLYF